MVFSSVPSYIDPSNWQQQQNHQIIGSSNANPLLQQPPPPHAAPPHQPHGIGGGTGAIRPGSMAERARMANIPMPEAALKCPRCDSSNTKFCYFNNYSLSQPRHFCKTCRRYWTRGGALRNVPVGGGCRRNKRSKSSTSKSLPGSDRQTNPSSTSATSTNSGSTASLLGLGPQLPPLRFMPSFGQLTDSFTGDRGLNYSGIAAPPVGTNEMNVHGASNLVGMASFLSSAGGGGGGGIEPWRLQQVHQQFPFLGGGLDTQSTAGIYQFHHGGELGFGESSHQVRPKLSSSMATQMAAVKMEDNGEQQNLSRQLLGGGMTGNNEQWSGPTSWTDLSSFSTSSTNNNPL